MGARLKSLGIAFVAAVVLGWGLDGPFWLLSTPSGATSEQRGAIARLHSWRGFTRATAATDLRKLGPTAAIAIPALVDHLDDVGWAEGFAEGFSKSFAFHGGPVVVFHPVYDALLAMGPAAVPELIGAIERGREGVRPIAAELLGELGDPRAIPVLRAALDPTKDRLWSAAMRSLGQFRDAPTLQLAIKRLHNPEWGQRSLATYDVEQFHMPEAEQALNAALSDPDQNVRARAGEALERLARWKQYPPGVRKYQK